MKRDMDLIRKQLLMIESSDSRHMTFNDCGDQSLEFYYNLDLLISAGIVKGKMNYLNRGRAYPVVSGLTWEGHEFLDAVRSESIWAKTKEHIKAKGLQSVPIELVMSTAIKIAKDLL